jgi:rhamnosyltransferase
VTYFPDELFAERLERVRPQVGKLLIVDNTPDSTFSSLWKRLSITDVEIIENRENLGIGAALNQGIARAMELGYSWTVSFDQDSWAGTDMISVLINIFRRQARPETVGIIGCNFEDDNLQLPSVKFPPGGPAFSESETVITSGSLLSGAVFSAAGRYRSDFFIDFVDLEYCLRLRKLGYKVLIATKPLMVHALGAATALGPGQRTGAFSLVLTNRSPLRRYYMTRNGLLVIAAYLLVAPKWTIKILTSILGFALLKIPMEKTGRWKKICATLYGAFDALRGRTGKASAAWLKE